MIRFFYHGDVLKLKRKLRCHFHIRKLWYGNQDLACPHHLDQLVVIRKYRLRQSLERPEPFNL